MSLTDARVVAFVLALVVIWLVVFYLVIAAIGAV